MIEHERDEHLAEQRGYEHARHADFGDEEDGRGDEQGAEKSTEKQT